MNHTAVSATLHCLTGCAIGEVAGMVLSQAFGLSNLTTVISSIVLAFFFGYSLSLRSVLRAGVALRPAVPLVLASDTLSITTMEITDNLVMVLMPGATGAGLSNALFWLTLVLSLAAAFAAAYPVNAWLLRRGQGHALVHVHMHHDGHASRHDHKQ